MPATNPKGEVPKSLRGKGFESRPQDINRNGAPRKLVSKLKDMGYTKREVTDTISNIIGGTLEELEALDDNKDATILERIIAKSLIRAYKNGSLYNLETLFSRIYGQPKQEVEATITEKPIFKAIELDVDDAVIVDETKKKPNK